MWKCGHPHAAYTLRADSAVSQSLPEPTLLAAVTGVGKSVTRWAPVFREQRRGLPLSHSVSSQDIECAVMFEVFFG